jgi:hypothetical protein
MERQPVTSSNLKSVGYDRARRVLEIEFQNGRVYRYHDVPPEEYEELLKAPSLGRYFNDNIRDGYQYDRAA